MAKKQEIDHLEQMAAEMTKLKEGFDILAEAVTSLNQKGLKVSLTDEQLRKISDAASVGVRNGASNIRLQSPDLSYQSEKITVQVSNGVIKTITPLIESKVKEVIAQNRIQVEHEHHHHSYYGTYASSERNRNMMVWLAFVTVLSLTSLVLFLMRWEELISWEWKIFPMIDVTVIVIAFLGFMIRLLSSEKR